MDLAIALGLIEVCSMPPVHSNAGDFREMRVIAIFG
jgi:hypothetical protein